MKRDADRGEMTLRPETVDDLWHLSHVVAPDDVASALTFRVPEEAATDKTRAGKLEKKPMVLGVKVERVEFHEFSNRLRLLGVIVEGPQEHGSHHTINVEPMTEVTIRKERWNRDEQERVEEAVEAAKQPLVTFVAMDDDDATVAHLRQYGPVKIVEVSGARAGKQYRTSGDPEEDYFEEVLNAVREQRGDGPLIVLGPGFWKERWLKFAREKDGDAVKGAHIENTAHSGMTGVHEAIRRGMVDQVAAERRAARDVRAVEEVFTAIAKDEPVTYGRDQVLHAINLGAAGKVLVVDDLVREGGTEVLDQARNVGAETVVVSGVSEAGRKLMSVGGYAALLRYALPDVV